MKPTPAAWSAGFAPAPILQSGFIELDGTQIIKVTAHPELAQRVNSRGGARYFPNTFQAYVLPLQYNTWNNLSFLKAQNAIMPS